MMRNQMQCNINELKKNSINVVEFSKLNNNTEININFREQKPVVCSLCCNKNISLRTTVVGYFVKRQILTLTARRGSASWYDCTVCVRNIRLLFSCMSLVPLSDDRLVQLLPFFNNTFLQLINISNLLFLHVTVPIFHQKTFSASVLLQVAFDFLARMLSSTSQSIARKTYVLK